MSEEQKGSLLSKAKGRIGGITALVVALAALLGALENLFEVSSRFASLFREETSAVTQPAQQDCFHAELQHVDKVTVSQWPEMPLSLKGRNDCRERLLVHLAYKARQLDKVRIESPVADCLDLVEPSCWEEKSLDTGALSERFIPPHLELLKKPLGDPVSININWLVYNVETLQQLDVGQARIQLLDDPQ